LLLSNWTAVIVEHTRWRLGTERITDWLNFKEIMAFNWQSATRVKILTLTS